MFNYGAYNADDADEDDDRNGAVGGVGVCVDIWVSCLVDLKHAKPANHVHEGGI